MAIKILVSILIILVITIAITPFVFANAFTTTAIIKQKCNEPLQQFPNDVISFPKELHHLNEGRDPDCVFVCCERYVNGGCKLWCWKCPNNQFLSDTIDFLFRNIPLR